MPKDPSIPDWLRAWIRVLSAGIQPDTSAGSQAARRALDLAGAYPERPPSIADRLSQLRQGASAALRGGGPAQAAAPPASTVQSRQQAALANARLRFGGTTSSRVPRPRQSRPVSRTGGY